MKILIISRGWPTTKDPKWGCFEKDQAEALKSLGHEVKVLCLDCRFSFKPYVPRVSRVVINEIEYLSFRGLPQALIALIIGAKGAIRMEQWMLSKLYERLMAQDFVPDVVYSHFILNSSAAALLKKKYGLPLVVIEHSSEIVKDKLSRIIIAQAKEAYLNADKVISVSDFLSRRIKEQFGVDSTVIPNMLGPEFIATVSTESKGFHERVKFLSVGALIPRKGYSELIDAFSKIKNRKWELNIIGYGNLHDTLQHKINKLGLSNNIHLLGPKSKNEIIDEMSKSDAFVLNTKKETFGVVYIEALSQGLPCIATECGGTEGIIGDCDGINVKVGNEGDLIKAIEYMLKNHHNYDKEDIRARCLQRYSPEYVAKQIEINLEEVISK